MATTVRRVRRIIRKIDPWTALKVSLVFYLVLALAIVLSLIVLWAIIESVGIPESLDSFLNRLGLFEQTSFIPTDDTLLRLAVFASLAWTVLMTAFTTLAAVMYNLVSDVVGGLEVTVLEESTVVPASQAPVRPALSWAPARDTGERPTNGETEATDDEESSDDDTFPDDGLSPDEARSVERGVDADREAIADLPTEETMTVGQPTA